MIAWLLAILRICAQFFVNLLPFLGKGFAFILKGLSFVMVRQSQSWIIPFLFRMAVIAAVVVFFNMTVFPLLGDWLSAQVLSLDIVNSFVERSSGYARLFWDSGLNLKALASQVWALIGWTLSCYASEFIVRQSYFALVNSRTNVH